MAIVTSGGITLGSGARGGSRNPNPSKPKASIRGRGGRSQAQLIEETRAAGQAFLAANPGAFGGGIDPKTGIRFSQDMKRLSAMTAQEALRNRITQARIEQAARARVILRRKQQAIKFAKTKLNRKERLSLIARESMRIAALARGRGFTRRESEKFIKARGGSITALRSAKRKGFVIVQPKIQVEEKQKDKKIDIKDIDVKLPKDIQKQIDIARKNKSFQTTKEINTTLENFRKTGTITNKILNLADIATGGALTENKIIKEQEKLNNRISKFNNKYSGKELTEKQFKQAESEKKFIDSEQKKIDKKSDSLATSKRDKIKDILFKNIGETGRLTVEQQQKLTQSIKEDKDKQRQIQANKPKIKSITENIKKKNTEISKLQNKKNRNLLEDIKLLKLKNQVNTLRTDVATLEFRAPPKIIAGEFPIIPASRIPSSISKISFLGAQKTGKGGKIVTDIIFKTNKGTMGVAKGVTVEKKGKIVSVVAGRSGKVSVKLLSGKRRIRGIQSFVGAERAKVKGAKFTSDRLRKIAKFQKTKQHTDSLRVIKSNIKGIEQAGLGRIATVKGKKFIKPFVRFPSGKISTKVSKGIDFDDFASISAILTKKDLSAIIGKTITGKGRKAEFIGLIKNIKGGDKIAKLSVGDKQQFSKATQKLFSSVASAVAKAEKTKGATTKPLKIAAAAEILSKTPSSLAKVTTRVVTKRKVQTPNQIKRIKKLKTEQKALQAQIVKVSQKVASISKQRSRQVSRQKTKQKVKQAVRQKTIQRAKQAQKQLSRLALKQKTILRQIRRAGGTVPRIPKIPRLVEPPKPRKKLVRISKKKKKQVQVFNVFGKSRGKFVKLNTKPLTRADALSRGAFAVDRTTAKTFKIDPAGKSKTPGKLLKNERNYFNRLGFKLREVKIRKGRKFKLKNKYIEKTKYGIDTKSEKSGLTIAKLLQQRKKKKSKVSTRKRPQRAIVRRKNTRARARVPPKTKRKITPTQRKVMLKNLKKARAAKKKLKGGAKK